MLADFFVHHLNPACYDINDINMMMAQSSDGSQADTESTDDVERADDADYLEPEDIIRHYWHGGNVKYKYVGHQALFLRTDLTSIPALASPSTADVTL